MHAAAVQVEACQAFSSTATHGYAARGACNAGTRCAWQPAAHSYTTQCGQCMLQMHAAAATGQGWLLRPPRNLARRGMHATGELPSSAVPPAKRAAPGCPCGHVRALGAATAVALGCPCGHIRALGAAVVRLLGCLSTDATLLRRPPARHAALWNMHGKHALAPSLQLHTAWSGMHATCAVSQMHASHECSGAEHTFRCCGSASRCGWCRHRRCVRL
jgi:hypothetical protein